MLYKINVAADGCEHNVLLQNVRRDETLPKSVITQNFATQTRGQQRTIKPMEFQDSNRVPYNATGYITLTWWLEGSPQTEVEDFYIVDSCGQNDGILRADIPRIGPIRDPGCNVLVSDRKTVEEEDRKKQRKNQSEQKRAEERKATMDHVRKNLAAERSSGRDKVQGNIEGERTRDQSK